MPIITNNAHLTNKHILLIVSGSISAYKSPDIVRRLQDLGASVKVCITQGGLDFITQMTLETVSKHPVILPSQALNKHSHITHIELAKWADAILVAPASANIIAQYAHGGTDNLATSLLLASTVPVLIAPAMNTQMLQAKITQDNLHLLQDRGVTIIACENGKQACGDTGDGRLAPSQVIAQQIADIFPSRALSGQRIIITAGATQEAIDPVRFISNHSSGKMAVAVADACVQHGAIVNFIHANMQVTLPRQTNCQLVISANDMYQAVMAQINECDIFIAVAAVANYCVKNPKQHKIQHNQDNIQLELVPTADILKTVCALKNKPFSVGFAAQTDDLMNKAQQKYHDKACDLLVANDVSRQDIGFGSDDNEVVIFHPNGHQIIGKNSKQKIAQSLINFIKKYHYIRP